ncbi:MAG: hypothetical protein EXR21_10005 [Flavobacteriaceae bacterium]|nr:hypothetical protein [Flavobacteriaceae bacterium]
MAEHPPIEPKKITGGVKISNQQSTHQLMYFGPIGFSDKPTSTSGLGTVTSVAMTVPSIFSVAGSPITTAGTLAVSLATQAINVVFAGPASGSSAATPTFRALVPADIPSGATSYIFNQTGAQASSNYNISGAGVIGTTLTVATSITVTALTATSVPFIGVAGLITQNATRLQWDDTNFRLLINFQGETATSINANIALRLGRSNPSAAGPSAIEFAGNVGTSLLTGTLMPTIYNYMPGSVVGSVVLQSRNSDACRIVFASHTTPVIVGSYFCKGVSLGVWQFGTTSAAIASGNNYFDITVASVASAGTLSFAGTSLQQAITATANAQDIAALYIGPSFVNGSFTTLVNRMVHIVQPASAFAGSGTARGILFTGGAHTGQTASTESMDVNINSARIVTWAAGPLTTQRNFLIQAPTYTIAGGTSIITNAATFAISGAPVAGASTAITNAMALWVQAGASRFDGDFVIGTKAINTTSSDSATINSPTGRFRKDTTGITFTLTNSYITANSIVILQYVTANLTAGNCATVQAGAGSATITFQSAGGLGEAPNIDADVNFWVVN